MALSKVAQALLMLIREIRGPRFGGMADRRIHIALAELRSADLIEWKRREGGWYPVERQADENETG